ncbi:MAG: M48 family metallopeptidase [Caldisericaceae bacterium]
MAIPVVIQRKNVKKINIRVTRDGRVVVSAPVEINDDMIEKILEKRSSWIAKKLEEMEVRKKYLPQFVDGGNVWLFGKPYVLRVLDGKKDEVSLRDGELLVKVAGGGTERVRHLVVEWLRRQAIRVIRGKIKEVAEVLDVKPERIELREWKSKWGLCKASAGTLGFNWKLIQLPDKLIDYIVVHELAHLRHHGHDRSFWMVVAKVLPDWKQRHRELKEWGGLLI